ncbi:MAG: chorismate synthase [Candidatus Latescibacterota bacterium]|jgi:chorismate synthase
MTIRYLSAGDSHGEFLLGIVEGLPAGVKISLKSIEKDLARRRNPYGRSSRQIVEGDAVSVVSGLWKGRTTGAPVGIVIPNRARTVKGRGGGGLGRVPRPGHADLAGMLKYGHESVPPVAERASARGTAMRVAIGSLARSVLDLMSIDVAGHVRSIGEITAPSRSGETPAAIRRRTARSPVYCADASSSKRMVDEIRAARSEGNSLGGSVEVVVDGTPPGLGSHVEWDRRLDARVAAAMMSIQSAKAVEVGDGIDASTRRGIDAHDAMRIQRGRVRRETNFAGGIEGGMTNGEPVVVRVFAKPIPTARRRAKTFDMESLAPTDSPYVRSDTCVVPALSVIAEAVAAWEILKAALDKFGGDHIDDTLAALTRYLQKTGKRFSP